MTDTTSLATELQRARAAGASAIKIYSDMEPTLVEAVAQGARNEGLEVWSHAAVFPTRPSDVVRSGVSVISHAGFLIWEVPGAMPETYNGGHAWNAFGPPAPYGSVRPDDPAVVAVLQDMRDRGVILDPTLTVMGFVGEEARDWAIEVTRMAHEMGIPISTGTDTRSLFDEIEALVRDVGLSPVEAIASATSVGAAAIGIDDDVGTVGTGIVADLVVYAENPVADVGALRAPSHVIRNGRVVRPRP